MDTARHHFDPERTIMIGDRLDTDILFGQQGGVNTLLVLTGIRFLFCFRWSWAYGEMFSTGVTKPSEIKGEDASPIVPDFVLQSIGDLVALTGEEAKI